MAALETRDRQVRLEEYIESIYEAERDVWIARDLLLKLMRYGLATSKDHVMYERIRFRVYEHELRLFYIMGETISTFSGPVVASAVMHAMPQPVPVPGVFEETRRPFRTYEALVASMNFNPRPHSAVPVVIWAVIALALLVRAGIAAAVYLSISKIADFATVREQTIQLTRFYEARTGCMTRCLDGGTSHADCVRQCSEGVPTPEQALPPPPDTTAGAGSLLVGLGALVGLGGLAYVLFKKGPLSSGSSSNPSRAVTVTVGD